MEDRQTEEAIEILMNSGVGLETVRLGSEDTFRTALESFIERVNLDRWEGDLDYLDEACETFMAQVIEAGALEVFPTDIDDRPGSVSLSRLEPPGIRAAVREVVDIGLEARYDREVSAGLRQDARGAGRYQGMTAEGFDAQPDWSTDIHRRDWRDTYETPEEPEPEALPVELGEARGEVGRSALTTLVQAFVQAVNDFVRGRELEAPTQEHGAER